MRKLLHIIRDAKSIHVCDLCYIPDIETPAVARGAKLGESKAFRRPVDTFEMRLPLNNLLLKNTLTSGML